MVPAVEEQSIEGLREERLVFGGITVAIRVSAEDSGAVAVMRAEPSMQPGRRPGGEPAYVLYYGGTLDAGELRKLAFEGEVAEPSVGGRPIDGGATLTIEGKRVDVIFRDLDAVKHWSRHSRPRTSGRRVARVAGRRDRPGRSLSRLAAIHRAPRQAGTNALTRLDGPETHLPRRLPCGRWRVRSCATAPETSVGPSRVALVRSTSPGHPGGYGSSRFVFPSRRGVR